MNKALNGPDWVVVVRHWPRNQAVDVRAPVEEFGAVWKAWLLAVSGSLKR